MREGTNETNEQCRARWAAYPSQSVMRLPLYSKPEHRKPALLAKGTVALGEPSGQAVELPGIAIPIRVLHKCSKNLAARLQQRVSDNDLQELLEAGPPALNHIVTEPVREHLSGQRRDGDTRALSFENVAEVLKVRVSATDTTLTELEGGDVGAAEDLVIGVHLASHAMGTWVTNLDFEKVLRWPVDLIEALVAGIRHGLQDRPVIAWARGRRDVSARTTLAPFLACRQFGGVELCISRKVLFIPPESYAQLSSVA
jgi:hypothetical protein